MVYHKIENGVSIGHQQDITGFSGTWVAAEEGFNVGDLHNGTSWSHPIKTTAELQAEARKWRDDELASTDNSSQTPDYPNRDAKLTYRVALRDWPSTASFPSTKPTI